MSRLVNFPPSLDQKNRIYKRNSSISLLAALALDKHKKCGVKGKSMHRTKIPVKAPTKDLVLVVFIGF